MAIGWWMTYFNDSDAQTGCWSLLPINWVEKWEIFQSSSAQAFGVRPSDLSHPWRRTTAAGAGWEWRAKLGEWLSETEFNQRNTGVLISHESFVWNPQRLTGTPKNTHTQQSICPLFKSHTLQVMWWEWRVFWWLVPGLAIWKRSLTANAGGWDRSVWLQEAWKVSSQQTLRLSDEINKTKLRTIHPQVAKDSSDLSEVFSPGGSCCLLWKCTQQRSQLRGFAATLEGRVK